MLYCGSAPQTDKLHTVIDKEAEYHTQQIATLETDMLVVFDGLCVAFTPSLSYKEHNDFRLIYIYFGVMCDWFDLRGKIKHT